MQTALTLWLGAQKSGSQAAQLRTELICGSKAAQGRRLPGPALALATGAHPACRENSWAAAAVQGLPVTFFPQEGLFI